jgi:hypothetical protein
VRTIVATTPAGVEWRVRVQWMPRWRALARRFGGWRRRGRERRGGGGGSFDVPAGLDLGDDLLAAIAIIVALILFALLFWFLLLPLLLLMLDLVVVIILLALAIPARVLLRRPWTVEAVTDGPEGAERRFTTQTVGWRRALHVRDEIVQKLRDGYPAPVVPNH